MSSRFNQTTLPLEQYLPDDPNWHRLCQAHRQAETLTALVLTAWRMGIWFAKVIVEQQLIDRAQAPTEWSDCSVCGTRLVSKGFAKRQMFTLIGEVKWKRRIGRCPRRCPGSQQVPFDAILNIEAHQQTSN